MTHANNVVIAAIDFTDASAGVADLGARAARRLKSRLLLLHAVEPTTATPNPMVPVADDIAPAMAAARELLQRMGAAMAAQGNEVDIEITVGSPDRIVEEAARAKGARLIVTGTHHRGPIGRLLIGSVAQKIVLRASCPVLVAGGDTRILERWLAGQDVLPVVIGIDRGGATTRAALDQARQLAALGPCDMTLVHEYWPPAEYARLGLRGARDFFDTDPEVAELLRREIEHIVGELGAAPNGRLVVRAAWGPIGEALAKEADLREAGLVVVGTEPRAALQRLARGSGAVSALHAVRTPLLCVPAEHEGVEPTRRVSMPPPIRRVLVTTDFSEIGNQAIGHALSLLRSDGGVIYLCHVHERPTAVPAYVYSEAAAPLAPEERLALERRLAELIPREATPLGIDVRAVVIDGGDAAAEIAAAALRVEADVIVLSSHGRTGVRRAVLGSIAEGVVRRAELPVFVVRRFAR